MNIIKSAYSASSSAGRSAVLPLFCVAQVACTSTRTNPPQPCPPSLTTRNAPHALCPLQGDLYNYFAMRFIRSLASKRTRLCTHVHTHKHTHSHTRERSNSHPCENVLFVQVFASVAMLQCAYCVRVRDVVIVHACKLCSGAIFDDHDRRRWRRRWPRRWQ